MGLVIRKKNIEAKNNLDASKPNLGTVDQAYFDYFMGQLLILILLYYLINGVFIGLFIHNQII